MIITQRGHAANMDARHRRGTEIHRHLVRLLVCEGIQNSLPTRRGSGSRLKRRHRGNPHRLDLMRSRRCSNQAVRYGVPGTTWIRDQPRNPPKYTEKRIRINFPFPCPSRGRAHARRVGSPARRVGSFRGYPSVMIFLAGVIKIAVTRGEREMHLHYFLSLGTFSGGGSMATLSLAPGMVGILPGSGKAFSGISFRSFLRSLSAKME